MNRLVEFGQAICEVAEMVERVAGEFGLTSEQRADLLRATYAYIGLREDDERAGG
jgi:hypothetical protein